MSTLSVPGAVQSRIVSFTNAPKTYLFDAPVSADSAQVYPEYLVIIDEGMRPTYEFEHTCMEQTDLVLMVYANTLQRVDEIVEIVKYNGGGISAGLGLDFGALPTLSTDYQDMEVLRQSERRFITVPTGLNSQRIFGCEMRYRVTLYRYTAN